MTASPWSALAHWSVRVADPAGEESPSDRAAELASEEPTDNLEPSPAAALAALRRVLSYLPDNVDEPAPVAVTSPASGDPGDLRAAMATLGHLDPPLLISRLVDRDSFFEIGRHRGPPRTTGLARVNGQPFALLANHPAHRGGPVDAAAAAKKTIRLIELAERFGLPLVCFADESGLRAGPDTTATLLRTLHQSSVPMATVVTGRLESRGAAIQLRRTGMVRRYAWPNSALDDATAASGFEVIDPDNTRDQLAEFLADARVALARRPTSSALLLHP